MHSWDKNNLFLAYCFTISSDVLDRKAGSRCSALTPHSFVLSAFEAGWVSRLPLQPHQAGPRSVTWCRLGAAPLAPSPGRGGTPPVASNCPTTWASSLWVQTSVKPAVVGLCLGPHIHRDSRVLHAIYSCLGSKLGFFLQSNPTGKCLGTASRAVLHFICSVGYLPSSLSFRS